MVKKASHGINLANWLNPVNKKRINCEFCSLTRLQASPISPDVH
jgi:hypothetical protein